jgi:peroxiredoxin
MIAEHETAPDFTVPGVAPEDESISRFSLTDATTDGPVVLVFYPFDFSPVCVEELCTFRDMEWLTFTEHVDVWGISVDSAHSHKQFIAEYDFGFPLLSDRLGEVADRYGVLMEEFEHHERVPKRSVVAIDNTRTVQYAWSADTQYQSPGTEQIEAAIGWYRQGVDEST